MGAADQARPRLQPGGGCARQQQRAHHLGAADSRRELSAAGDLHCFSRSRSNQFNSSSSVVRRKTVLSWLLSRFIGDGYPVGPASRKPGEPSGPRGRSTDQDEARGFHHGPEQITELLAEAVYTNATGFTLVDRRLATGAGSIYEGSIPPPPPRSLRFSGSTSPSHRRSDPELHSMSYVVVPRQGWTLFNHSARHAPLRLPSAKQSICRAQWRSCLSNCNLDSYRWRKHCNGLFQTPAAA